MTGRVYDRRVKTLIAVLAAAGTLVLPLAAPGAPPTRASWSAGANRICAVGNAYIRALPRPTTSALLVADLRAIFIRQERWLPEVASLPVPVRDRAPVGRLVALLRAGQGVYGRELIPALARGDQKAAGRASAKLAALGRGADAIARKLGANVCAIDPQPEGASGHGNPA